MIVIAALMLALVPAAADEGMWLLPLLQQLNAKALAEAGCHLTPDQIYSINHSSLKDAIVQFDGGCTAEIVSDEGLLFTNHHCGYDPIQKLSTVEHDYLKDGYWAMTRSEELPCPGVEVKFLISMTDVTKRMLKAKDKDAEETRIVAESERLRPDCEASVVSFYDDNYYYLILEKTYKDIRFVGAPPSSIGKFGGDTDNWEWPRHTGDFSMFRIYAGPDNEPAEYSPANVPFTPAQSLKVSLKGVEHGDFTMVIGFPGATTRYMTSPELDLELGKNSIAITCRDIRQEIMMDAMESDPAIKIQYASKYAQSSNGWKKWKGEAEAVEKLGVLERTKEQEEDFNQWVGAKKSRIKKYGGVVDSLHSAVKSSTLPEELFTLGYETLYQIELGTLALEFINGLGVEGDMTAAFEEVKDEYKSFNPEVDKAIAAAMLKAYRYFAFPELYPENITDDFEHLDIDAYVDSLYAGSAFSSADKLEREIQHNPEFLASDPALDLVRDIYAIVISTYQYLDESGAPLKKYRSLYTQGLMEWHKDRAFYPDANFTMRLTYGHVGGYHIKDGVDYMHYTTALGVMEKYKPGDYEFDVPEKLLQLIVNEDFGEYAMDNGEMPCCFLSNNDITGGNSGSPVLNADGELVGLAFDGNWESMSSDIMFEPELQRCINVDIRYVLFIIDKFGGAGHLLDEMNIVR